MLQELKESTHCWKCVKRVFFVFRIGSIQLIFKRNEAISLRKAILFYTIFSLKESFIFGVHSIQGVLITKIS